MAILRIRTIEYRRQEILLAIVGMCQISIMTLGISYYTQRCYPTSFPSPKLAELEGLEPPKHCCPPVFKTGSSSSRTSSSQSHFNRKAILLADFNYIRINKFRSALNAAIMGIHNTVYPFPHYQRPAATSWTHRCKCASIISS